MGRHDGRQVDQLREIRIQHRFTSTSAGSVLIECGQTMILCTASLERGVPPWKMPKDADQLPSGWVTAEYNMLPGSTTPRKRRDRTKVDGRTTEIQRLIGRSLRAVVDFEALGGHTVTVDCDVLQADGGTRTAAITGGFLALRQAVEQILPARREDGWDLEARPVLTDSVAAVSVGVVGTDPVLDLDYVEDSAAEVDMNVIMTGRGKFIEVQGTAEGAPFDEDVLQELLRLARGGIAELTEIQNRSASDV